ncbi:NADH-quinone oxidoreductase subunit 5 family protein [Candidatus Sarmatiella mevalonica]|uniref:NADH-quinone oxidoreductase subunit 5 family protein n=1 Tax=Candidatus Sarmatiella mevalonica TaxID=2770581 RepID=UPI001922AFDB|nr:proton-conducting transporter membrane subunit [Candidatus Sarmatiella mevalonica]
MCCASAYLLYCVLILEKRYNIELLSCANLYLVNIALQVDALAAQMIFLVTVVSCAVHVYSCYYLEADQRYLFISYLSLFTFFMLLLVTSANFIQLFIGWEGVGLCSYLLIGFYNTASANSAALSAIIINRFGDVAMMCAMALFFYSTHSFNLEPVNYHSNILLSANLPYIAYLLLFACCVKSAQIFAHSWLIGAMQGPTPASALIHAATMVTAGIFFIIKCRWIFNFAQIMHIMQWAGLATAVLCAALAIIQSDLKKIIAYSTSSQLGYMLGVCGCGAYEVAGLHLFVHGFFKSLMFLCAGVIIHATQCQNIYQIKLSCKQMPATFACLFIAVFSLIGAPPLAGFISKELMMHAIHQQDGVLYYLALLGVACTTCYAVRLLGCVFFNKFNVIQSISPFRLHGTVSDARVINRMNIVLVCLTACSIFLSIVLWNSEWEVMMTQVLIDPTVVWTLCMMCAGGFIGWKVRDYKTLEAALEKVNIQITQMRVATLFVCICKFFVALESMIDAALVCWPVRGFARSSRLFVSANSKDLYAYLLYFILCVLSSCCWIFVISQL